MKLALLGINTIAQLAKCIAEEGSDVSEFFGYDDDVEKKGKNINSIQIVGNNQQIKHDFESGQINAVVICFGEKHLQLKKRKFEEFSVLNFNFPNLISNSAIISPLAKFGLGNIVSLGVVIGHNTEFENDIVVWAGAVIEHDCVIRSHVYIGPNVTFSGFVEIGECTLIGSGAVILPSVKVGRNCVIGAGSVVTKDINDNQTVKGNPAR